MGVKLPTESESSVNPGGYGHIVTVVFVPRGTCIGGGEAEWGTPACAKIRGRN